MRTERSSSPCELARGEHHPAGLCCELGGDTLPERLLRYMAAATELLRPRLFIFVNLRGCLTEEEAAALYPEEP